MIGIIYEYYNLVTNVYYIGLTVLGFARRNWQHLHNKLSNYFDNVYLAHTEQFSSRVLLTVSCKTKEKLVQTLNAMEIAFILIYKSKGNKLYNIAEGGNLGYKNLEPTDKMLEALNKGRDIRNALLQENKLSEQERKARHCLSCEKYKESHPDLYKKTYTEANLKRKLYKHLWYLLHKESQIAKIKQKRLLKKQTLNLLAEKTLQITEKSTGITNLSK